MQRPAATSVAAIAGAGAAKPSRTRLGALAMHRRYATKSGRRGWKWIAAKLPRTDPTPKPATIIAHAEEPPSDCFATTGPRTLSDAMTISWKRAKPTMLAHSQRRAVTSRHPAASSRTKLARGGAARAGRRRRERSHAATPKVAAAPMI